MSEEAAPPAGASLHVDWPEYHRLIERLAVLVYESGYRFDFLLCLARGGMRVGDVLSRVFEVPLAILAASSYREAGGTVAGELDIARFITSTRGEPAGRLLLVDDLVDSGNTLQRVGEHLRQRFPAIQELRTAVLWYKEVSLVAPDYFVERLANNPWIYQPFERYDGLRPGELAEQLRNSATQTGVAGAQERTRTSTPFGTRT
ncbi:Nicotinate phosphoribosyltransferase [Burkholderiales bacterium]|nr:Nicotinate phosphoribosyltransferase [Burkholderiales bacterium]